MFTTATRTLEYYFPRWFSLVGTTASGRLSTTTASSSPRTSGTRPRLRTGTRTNTNGFTTSKHLKLMYMNTPVYNICLQIKPTEKNFVGD